MLGGTWVCINSLLIFQKEMVSGLRFVRFPPGRFDYTGRVMVRQQTIWYRSQLVKKLKIDRYYRSQLVRNLKIDRYVSRTKIVQYQELL